MTIDLAARPTPFAGTPPSGKLRRSARSDRALIAPLRWDTVRIALAILTLLSISRIQEEIPLIAVFRPGPLLTALCLVLAIAKPRTVRWSEITRSKPARIVMLLFAVLVALIPLGLSVGASATYVLDRFLATMIFFVLIVIAIRDIGDLRFLIGSYVISLIILAYSGFFLWQTTYFNGFARVGSSGMYDANDLAPLFGAGLPMALLFAQTSGRIGRWLGYTAALCTPALIAITGSRGGFLALIATGLGLLVMTPGMTAVRRFGIVALASVVMAVAAPPGYIAKMGTIFDQEGDYNFTEQTGRIAIWKRGLGYLAEHPLTGVGIGNYGRAQWENPVYTETGAQLPVQAPHNTFLEVLVELGIPAAALWMSVLWIGSVGLTRLRNRLPKRWMKESAERRFLYLACSYLPVSIFGWSVGAFFVSHAYLAPYYLLAAFVGTVLVMTHRQRRRDLIAARAAALPAVR